jgi:hypothetical protein
MMKRGRRHMNPEKIRRIREVLERTLREIETILQD